jgi:hypothetical protein
MIVTFILTPTAAAGAETALVAVVVVAGAGEGVLTEVVGVAPVFGRNVPTSQVSTCGANVTLSPFIPVTKRPLRVVLPVPSRELSGWRARVKGPAEFWI